MVAIIYSPLLVWISGRFKRLTGTQHSDIELTSGGYIWRTAILISIVYPMLYFLAGYFIAWQSEAVRLYYTGSTELKSFIIMLIENIKDGLYFFQILRGALWVLFALPVLMMLRVNFLWKGILLGLLFAFLMNAQHLLPNPYFPREVAQVHFLETASSNFVWGFVISLMFHWRPTRQNFQI